MGSRGQSSRKGFTSAQKAKADNLKRLSEKRGYTDVKFHRNEAGEVEYTYTEKKTVQEVHGGFQAEEKNDVYERTIVHSGRIGKDGLITRNKDEKTDVLIKKGSEPKRKKTTAGDWIKKQTNVDIEKYRDAQTKQFDKRGVVTVDWKRMPRTERAYIEDIARRYPNRIQIFDMGSWAKQIIFKG